MCKNEQFAELVSIFITHRSQLCQVAMKILGSRDKADDVVHDAYIKVLEAETLFVIKQPVAYLNRIVRNLAIDHYRRFALESAVFATAEEGVYVTSPETPETTSINRQELQLVALALDELPERTRNVFELYRMGGHTQREIAAMLDVSPTLVNFMIRDALNKCRSALDSII